MDKIAEIDRCIAEDEARVARQREFVEQRRIAGLDTSATEGLLETFERLLEAPRARREVVRDSRWP